MTQANRSETLRIAIEALIRRAHEGFNWAPDTLRDLKAALAAGNPENITKSEEVCRQAIEQLEGPRANALTIHEVSVLFGMSVKHTNQPWLSEFRKARPDRVEVNGAGERLYRLDDMLKLRQAYRQKAVGASKRAAEGRWGDKKARRDKAMDEAISQFRRLLKEMGKLEEAAPHLQAIRNICSFIQQCAESVVFASTTPLNFVLNAEGLVVDSGVWPLLSSDEIAAQLMSGGSLVSISLHDALCMGWTDNERLELWVNLWKLGEEATRRRMDEGWALGRQWRAGGEPVLTSKRDHT